MDLSDALVAKTLVDFGLRAPRTSFPAAYLEHVDDSLMRTGWELGAPSSSSIAVKKHWDGIGEDPFASIRRDYSVVEGEGFFAGA